MERYQIYKTSGIEWIGEIPEHWEIRKFKFLFKEKKSTPNLSLSSGSISFGEVIYKDDEGIPEERKETYQEVLKGEFLINPLNLNFDLKSLRIGLSDINVVVSPGYIVLILNKENNKDYFKYLLRTFDTQQMKSLGNGVRQTISFNHLSSEELVLPPLSEQNQIVQFLDSKTELIDKLISTKEKKISLLKEQRTSLINQVVTKGLNTKIKMKGSGVEWIGDIPENWICTKFNRYVFFQEGPGLRTFQFTDEGTKVICVTNITENGIDFTYKKFISNEEYLEKYQHFTVQKGDLLLSSSGNSWGKVSEYLEDEKVMLNTSTIRLNTLDSKRLNKTLIKYILKSGYVRTQLDILMTGSCQPNFGPSHLNQLFITVPPIEEQFEIISNIEKHDFEFHKLIQFEQRKIDLLKEYRQSLISEVVTGKIKVSN